MADNRQFFYDGQIRRFLTQFIRAMSHFQVEFGKDSTGATSLLQVPVLYGDPSRQASAILRNNSENAISNVPAMAVYITAFQYDKDRVQEPTFIDKKHIRQRKFDADTQSFTNRQGNAFTVERHMPVPYTLTLKLDIWTSNTTQKFQLLEQIAPIFNPALELQNSDNYLDWTSLSFIELTDVNYSSRSVPAGAEDDIDIATLTFDLPVWITPPAKLKKLGVIHRIIASVQDTSVESIDILDDNLLNNTRIIITPTNHKVVLVNTKLQLFRIDGNLLTNSGSASQVPITQTPEPWDTVLNLYGKFNPGITQIRLLQDDGITEVVGTIIQDTTDASIMDYSIDVDTIPANNLLPVTAIIDPIKSGPGAGLIAAAVGQRYLILSDIGDSLDGESALAWRGTNGAELVAGANDIVAYDGTQWHVLFDSSLTQTEIKYVTNLTTVTQFKFTNNEWTKSYDGEYQAGRWSVIP